MPDNGSIQKRDAHEMAHGRPVQITEHTTVTELQPSLSDVVCANKKLQIGFIVALVVLALLSGFVARPHFADTKTWDSTIEVIDQKKGNVLALTTSCVALSAGITALPGDTGTPVAEQLAQLSGNLGIVLAVLYLEKYLLTILWSVGLGILIPFALVLFDTVIIPFSIIFLEQVTHRLQLGTLLYYIWKMLNLLNWKPIRKL